MEKAFGKVESIKGDMAVVLIRRGSMCGESCSGCGMCGDSKTKITAKNIISAQVGDNVVLSVSTSEGLKAAILVYGIPVFILVLSAVLLLKAGFPESVSVLAGFIIMALWFFVIFILEKMGKFKKHIFAQIVEKRG